MATTSEHHEKQIDLLWAEVKKRLPIWIFAMFAALTFGIMGLQYHRDGKNTGIMNTISTDVEVIKSELKHMNGKR